MCRLPHCTVFSGDKPKIEPKRKSVSGILKGFSNLLSSSKKQTKHADKPKARDGIKFAASSDAPPVGKKAKRKHHWRTPHLSEPALHG